jgi:hypothetical protein
MIDGIQNIQSSPCGTGACKPSANTQEQAPATRASQTGDTVKISKQGLESQNGVNRPSADRPGESELNFEQQREVNELKKTDQKVKAHERAHMAAGAGLVMGGANYQYQRGPDGKMYAVGGEVKIDTSREKDPKETATKMQQVKRAALAPSQPSSQDRSVAAQASQIEAEARAELLKKNTGKVKQDGATDGTSSHTVPAAYPNAYNISPTEPRIKTIA